MPDIYVFMKVTQIFVCVLGIATLKIKKQNRNKTVECNSLFCPVWMCFWFFCYSSLSDEINVFGIGKQMAK